MKYRLYFILFLTVLLSCKNTQGNDNDTKIKSEVDINKAECIESILNRDSEFGKIRNHSSEQISLSETIDNYTNSIKFLDYSNCPDKFKIAFHEHIEAWMNIKRVSDKYPELRGELHEIFSELEKNKDSLEFKSLEIKLFDTWKVVEEITKKY
jgi:uncharacterized protein YaaN involved in tellurite resistance